MINPGKIFEEEIGRSIPKMAGSRKIWIHKPPDVPQFGLRCRRCRKGMLKRRCAVCQAEDAFDPRFTPKNPCDLILSIPCRDTGKMRSSVIPQVVFAFEFKRSVGTIPKRGAAELHGLLAFKRVKKHQVDGLKSVAASGGVAGVLWLTQMSTSVDFDFGPQRKGTRTVWPKSACYFIQIDRWEAYKADAKGASLSLAAARKIGIEVEQDVGRGRERRYWKLPELFIAFGADVKPTPEHKAKPRRRIFES